MYKLLIADDEVLLREGLTAMIDWQRLPLKLSGCAADGLEAYEMIVQTDPDIVLTDIRMPELDGLELIKKALAFKPALKFIIFSGYDDFEYAHTAMRSGVRHYLLKPSSNEELNTALAEVIKELNQLQESQSLLRHLSDKSDEQSFRQFLLEGDFGRQEWNYYQKNRHSAIAPGLIAVFSLAETNEALYFYALHNILNEILGVSAIGCQCRIVNHLVLLLPVIKENSLRQSLEKIQTAYRNFCQQSLTIVIEKYIDFSNLPQQYLKIQEFLKENSFFYQGKILQERDLLFYEYNQNSPKVYDFSAFIQALNHEPLDSALTLADSYFTVFRQKRYSQSAIRHFFLALLNTLFSQISEEDRMIFFEKIIPLLHQGNPLQLQPEVHFIVEHIWYKKHNLKSAYSNSTRCLLEAAGERLTDPALSLKFLANEVLFMNKDYIGKQFKREIGQTFSEYLTQLRMEKALSLIANLSLQQLNQLPAMIGYQNNPAYFQRLFKNYTGKTPYQYKKDQT